jgi:DNA uptake protein ComE-like DNA-binding protein
VGNKPIKATKTPFTGIVSVNSGSPAELKKLKGIGPTRAKAIKAGRPYKAIDELDSKQIIPHGVYQNIKAQLTL